MLIPLGILASSGGFAEPAYELIETSILTSSASSVTFSNLGTYSSTYKHLQIRAVARTSFNATNGDALRLRFNGDSGANYSVHNLDGNGSSVTSSAATGLTGAPLQRVPAALDTANSYGALVTDLLDVYAAKNKTVRNLAGFTGSFNRVFLNSSAWFNTASLTSIEVGSANGANLVAGSRFSLYGVKG
jgi:hypothetical protein